MLCSFANTRDVHHDKATALITSMLNESELIITDHIFDEVLSVTSRKAGRSHAIMLGKYIIQSEFRLVQTGRDALEQAWKAFQKYEYLSFTDCTIISLMKVSRIKRLATFDKHFKNIEGIETVDS